MMKINHDRMYILRRAMREVFKESHIEIMNSGKDWGINWGAIGTVDTETTRDFAAFLDKAADLVDHLNEWEVKDGWDDDPALESLDCDATRAVLAKGCEMSRMAIVRMDWKALKAALTMDAEKWK